MSRYSGRLAVETGCRGLLLGSQINLCYKLLRDIHRGLVRLTPEKCWNFEQILLGLRLR